MGFLRDYRSARRDDQELGRGVWRRAHDRFQRGLDRYHQMLEAVTDPTLRAGAIPVANDLADLLPRVRAVCMEAHRRAPSQTQDIPASKDGYLSDVHRMLSRGGNAMAQTAESLTMARFAAPAPEDGRETKSDPRVQGIERRAASVHEYVEQAEALLRS